MKKKSKAADVIEWYPKAYPLKDGKNTIIVCDHIVMGKGKNARCAWASAYKNYVR